MRIVFHGENAGSFSPGFAELVGSGAEIAVVPDILAAPADRRAFEQADVIVGVRFDVTLPPPRELRLFHVPGAGYDGIDLAAVPASAVICNCFGHEQPIAEYVMAVLLSRYVPLGDADRRLRDGDWTYWAGAAERAHDELAGKTIGLLGFGHIGKAIATRAKAFEMRVHVANRSPVATSRLVDASYSLEQLRPFWGSAEFFVISVPLAPETRGIVGAEAFAVMRPNVVIINVGRGATIDERALYDALHSKRIAGAAIDAWYRYPSPDQTKVLPSKLPFHQLPNIIMTPHMSGWTAGTIRRRQRTIADNIRRVESGEPCLNVVRASRS
jgi:phosphoglycerate dehydrogenase-like enzyme